MRKFIIAAIFILIHASSYSFEQEDSLFVKPFGKVFIYKKTPSPENVIIMISGDAGWKYGVVDFAKKFSEKNAVVAGVDILRYFKELRRRFTDCYDVSEDFKILSEAIAEKYSVPAKAPVLMGYSSGATLVYGILAQSSPGSFKGGISLGFCPDLELPKKLCEINGLKERADSALKSIFLLPHPGLSIPWIVLHGTIDKVCSYDTVVTFAGRTGNAALVTLPKVGHGFSVWTNFMPQWEKAYDSLLKE